MHFTVRYFDPRRAGVVEDQVSAASEAELRGQWAEGKSVLIEVRAEKAPRSRTDTRSFDVAWWCRELRTLLTAGMTAVEALETLREQSRGSEREAVNASLLRSLHEGQSLSRAMREARAFPEVLIASVTASERTSTLVAALGDFLRYDEMLRRLRKEALSAAIYPGVVITLGTLIAMFLLLYVIPRFSRMYVDFSGTVSVPTQLLIWVSRALNDHAALVFGSIVAIAVALAWLVRHGYMTALALALAERVVLLRRQLDHFRLAKIYQSLALMFKGGYTLDEALGVCKGLGLGAQMDAGIVRAIAELTRGRSVAAAFSDAGLTEPVSARLLAVGERSGNFDSVLQTIADRHAEAFSTFVERATRIVEPLLLLVVALVVGGIVLMMYMPIFDIAGGIR